MYCSISSLNYTYYERTRKLDVVATASCKHFYQRWEPSHKAISQMSRLQIYNGPQIPVQVWNLRYLTFSVPKGSGFDFVLRQMISQRDEQGGKEREERRKIRNCITSSQNRDYSWGGRFTVPAILYVELPISHSVCHRPEVPKLIYLVPL
jgi:hypothetical protein